MFCNILELMVDYSYNPQCKASCSHIYEYNFNLDFNAIHAVDCIADYSANFGTVDCYSSSKFALDCCCVSEYSYH